MILLGFQNNKYGGTIKRRKTPITTTSGGEKNNVRSFKVQFIIYVGT